MEVVNLIVLRYAKFKKSMYQSIINHGSLQFTIRKVKIYFARRLCYPV
jgi:hypothetical protein